MELPKFISDFLGGLRAQRLAEQECRRTFPGEIIHGTALCANEPTRFVVRVFCGQRDATPERLPPWTSCKVFGIPKTPGNIEVIADEKYWPTIR